MYGLLWRVLPGPWWVRLLLFVLIVCLVLAALAIFVFPWVQATFFDPIDITVDGLSASVA
ncbi:MAG TPA: hypothetical protein GX406_08340 [Pseudoclavibacter sp.]|nr:hypothetical protein [Pseudoclavibacter sp.]